MSKKRKPKIKEKMHQLLGRQESNRQESNILLSFCLIL